eukprot:33992_1
MKEIGLKKTDIQKINDNSAEYVEFRDSFHVSIHCHICKHNFDDYNEYKEHIQKHYETDNNKTWKQCDFGCEINPIKPYFFSSADFISHIAQHTQEKPFKCDVIVNGIKCLSSVGTRSNLKHHWKTHFNKHYKKKKKKKKKKRNINQKK